MENCSEWVEALTKRLSSALPHRIQNQLWTPANDQIILYTVKSIVDLSQEVFPPVISGLSALLQELNKTYPPGTAQEIEMQSYCTVLDCLQQCLAKRGDTSLEDEDIHALQMLYQRITHLCLLHGENTHNLSLAANKVLYQLSGLHFHGIFNKIILRMTSVNRVLPFSSSNSSAIPELPSSSTTTSDHLCVIGLIPHLNLNASRLQQILQAIVTSFKDLHKRNKQLFVTIPPMLHKSIWNFIQEYPFQFNEVLNNSYPSLERSAEKLFNLCDEYADSTKKRVHIWPLQNAALILCPNTLKDITESVEKSSPTHRSQRNFVTSLQKALSSGKREKEMTEAALICAIDLFKAGSFVGDRSIAFFRYFITIMQGQLHSLLFSPGTPFLHNSSSIQASIPTFTDRDLMMNCLVAQFRCNHMNSHIFNICLDPHSPTVFRVAFVDAMDTVVRETSLSWWPNNNAVYLYGPQLRQIFQTTVPLLRRYENSNPNLMGDVKAYLTSPLSATAMLQNKSKTERKNLVEMVTNYQLIRGLVRLFGLDPMLAFSELKETDRVGECLYFMTSLVGLIQHQSLPILPLRVSETLLLLHRPENIERWDQNDSMNAFWDISGQVTYSIAMKLFSRKTNNLIQLLEWLKKILHYRTQFLKGHVSEALLGTSCKILQQMYTMLETVLLLFLRNTDIHTVRVAMSCFKYLVLEAELVDSSLVPYTPNIWLYRQLEQLSTAPPIGRAAQQKKLRGILKGLVHTPGSALAWEDTYSSWRVTKANLISYQRGGRDDHSIPEFGRFQEGSFPRGFMRRTTQTTSGGSVTKELHLSQENLQSEMMNWTNMTGFLCSLAGVSTKSSPSSYTLWLMNGGANGDIFIDGADMGGLGMPDLGGPPTSPVRDPNHIRMKRSSSYHGGRPKSMTQINQPPSRIASVHHNSIHDRSQITHRGSTSSESNMEDKSSRTSQTQSFVNELMQLLRCDNEAVGVQLRETVKEMVSYELSPPVYSYLFQCMNDETSKILAPDKMVILTESNTAMVDQLVSIVQHVVDTNTEEALEHLVHVQMDEIVLNFIMYVHKMDTSERSLTIKIKICHLISSLMQHHMDLNFRAEVQFRNQVAEFMALWMRGEVVISENPSHEETLQSDLDLSALRATGLVMSGLVLQSKFKTSDVFEEKGKLFLKYFKTFMNLIHSLNQVQWSTLSPIHKQPLLRHCASLREFTIQAMSNMLTANIDSGLIHAIGLGYHDDLKTRVSFIEVLTSILKQGAEFNSLADTALADRFNTMLDLVAGDAKDKGDFPVMMALINAVPVENLDELAEVLVTLFDYKNKLASFLTRILNTEVEALESGRVDTLFRGNSIACKVLSLSFKTFGLYYLQSVVRPLIMDLIKNSEADFEVDPTRLSDQGKLKANQKNLSNLVEKFYRTIQKSLPSLPLQLRMLCHILYSVVVTHFPDSSVDTVNSAIFLRFINPAIVSPQSYGLIQGEVPNNVRRGLTFLSKVLQNLANHVLFKKEAHMEVFNDFLCDNFECSRQLALNMASMGPYLEGEAVEYIGFQKEIHKHKLHMLLWNNQEKVSSYAASIRTSVSSRYIFQELNTLLAQLGAPNYRRARTLAPPASTVSPSGRGTGLISSQLEEFLDTMANECDEKTLRSIKAKDVFYQGGRSRAGNPVFYWIARKFRGDQVHTSNQLLYHVMSMLKSNTTDRVFELVVDLTQATAVNEPDLELLVKFAAYVPEIHMSHIENLYFFNTNLAFKQSANKFENMSKVFSHIKGTKRLVMLDSYSKFSDHIDHLELRLPSDTVAYEENSKTEYDVNFLMFKQLALPIPATLLVCDCGMVVSLVDRIKVFDIPITLKEMYHISDIREVFCEDKGSLAVRMIEGGHVLKFNSSRAEAIAKDISNCMSKWQNQQPSRYMSERKLEPKDVPGTFINLALLNLGSTDSALRATAYKLLSAAKDTFQLRIDRRLESSHDLCIPVNCADFVVSVSTQLAQNHPHLTLEFLSEVMAGFQRYSSALKQHCLAYISPWLPNLALFAARRERPSEQEKLMKLIDLLVALTVSEDKMYPLIQAYIWKKIGKEVNLLKQVLRSFIKMGMTDGLGSRKVEVLADTAVTLEQGEDGIVVTEILKKLLSTIAHTSNRVTTHLDDHTLWAELAVLSRFMLALSFNNKVNVAKNLADIFYFCVLMMASGPVFVRATIHGIILNTVQSLGSLPEVMANEEALKEISLKLVEFSDPKFFMQFGITSPASTSGFLQTDDQGVSSRHPSTTETVKVSLSSTAVLTVTQHLVEVVHSCVDLIPDCYWTKRWQRLARRTAFYYNPALQTRSFLMLGMISEKTKKMSLLIAKSLKVLEDTLYRHEEDVGLLEAIISCLTHLVPLLDQSCEDLSLHQHLFWVAVGILQQGEPTLYSAGLELMESCIKVFTANYQNKENLREVMENARDSMEWPLTQMDRQVGLSFTSHFHFALAGLLYRGFSHSLSDVRTRALDLLTTLFFMHSPELTSTLSSTPIIINKDNLAYLAALFPESELMREQLINKRWRPKQGLAPGQSPFTPGLLPSTPGITPSTPSIVAPPTPNISDLASDSGTNLLYQHHQQSYRDSQSFSSLLSTDVISGQKEQVLFLLVLASALVQTHDEQKVDLLYHFLCSASDVFVDVFPLIHSVLVEHMHQTLQQTQNLNVLGSVQKLTTTAVRRKNTIRVIKSSYINDIGFGGLSTFFKPFPKHHPVYPTPQGALFQKYISSLTAELLPANEQMQSSGLKGSLSKLSMASTGSSGSSKDYAPSGYGRKMSPWASTGGMHVKTGGSREVSPGSVDNLSMDELDTSEGGEDREETTL